MQRSNGCAMLWTIQRKPPVTSRPFRGAATGSSERSGKRRRKFCRPFTQILLPGAIWDGSETQAWPRRFWQPFRRLRCSAFARKRGRPPTPQLDRRTLLYLASDSDGSGPWLYSMNVERRIPHRLTPGLDRYTSLAASADGRRLVATLAIPKKTLWRLRITDSSVPTDVSAPVRISLTTSTGSSPRLGPNYLLYVSGTGTSESIWKFSNETATELWSGQGARVFGGPAISPDGRSIAFSVRRQGRTFLYVVQADGTGARIVADSLDLEG